MKNVKLNILLTIVFLLLVVFNCSDTFEQEIIPSGMGSFLLYLDEQNPRTIMPDTPDFVIYELKFTGSAAVILDRTKENLNDPIHLLNGTYNLFVTAYIDNDKEKPAAWGSANDIEINEGAKISRTIPLNAFNPDGTGFGIFYWNVHYPAGITDANMKITPLNPATGTSEQTLNFTAGSTSNTGSRQLNSGYYNVLFSLKKSDTHPLEWVEILHVYQNMVSSYNHTFGNEYFNNTLYTVTYVFNDETTPDDGGQTRLHGSTAMALDPIPTRTDHTFGGWYTVDGSLDANDTWNFDTPLIRNRTLYARWYKNLTASDFTLDDNSTIYDKTAQSVIVDYIDTNMDTVTAGDITVYYSGTDYTESTAAPANAGTYDVTVTTTGGSLIAALDKTAIGQLTINPKELTITGVSAEDKEYDGTPDAAVTGTALIDGVIAGDTVTLNAGTAEFADINAANNKTVTFSGFSIGGTDADNYTLPAQPENVTANITLRSVTINLNVTNKE